tara:strand:- start:429 stop:1373 length:945 start_codon:yes stop_codon:yes gene_type:complete
MPYIAYQDNGATIWQGDCREVLRGLEESSVNCVVTSPPYWGLRDYGADGQLGLEETPADHVANMVEVFREVRRVLREDGTLWLNYGDSYANTGCQSDAVGGFTGERIRAGKKGGMDSRKRKIPPGLKPKDLCGIPWRVAFALQEDGWWLRQDIIWHKPNPMPEGCTDRCTKSHEYIFLMAKSPRYYYDADAVRESNADPTRTNFQRGVKLDKSRGDKDWSKPYKPAAGRNRRSVWTIPVNSYPGAHFATFPPELVKPCIMAGCPDGGTVLDPFTGSGTVAEVARANGCKFVGAELNPEYIELAKKRLQQRGLFV